MKKSRKPDSEDIKIIAEFIEDIIASTTKEEKEESIKQIQRYFDDHQFSIKSFSQALADTTYSNQIKGVFVLLQAGKLIKE